MSPNLLEALIRAQSQKLEDFDIDNANMTPKEKQSAYLLKGVALRMGPAYVTIGKILRDNLEKSVPEALKSGEYDFKTERLRVVTAMHEVLDLMELLTQDIGRIPEDPV